MREPSGKRYGKCTGCLLEELNWREREREREGHFEPSKASGRSQYAG